jgi:hypothetical protein
VNTTCSTDGRNGRLYKSLVRKSDRKNLLRFLGIDDEDNIKMDLKEI